MILVDKPYVSGFLKETAQKYNLPVLATSNPENLGLSNEPFLKNSEQALGLLDREEPIIYTNSENTLEWISRNLGHTPLPARIEIFKNKVKFRQAMKPLFPDFYFQEIALSELGSIDTGKIPLPCIIKPSIGFFSIGVYKVSRRQQWPEIIQLLQKEMGSAAPADYPKEVVDTTKFIIEECIEGDEYAVDAYFDNDGKPVVMNIHQHYFSSAEDVSDRVYVSSREIIESQLGDVTRFLENVGKLTNTRNFPVHIELRKTAAGVICPIEVNPLRFGGWCTTGDATALAYGFNPYQYYFEKRQPDWDALLEGKEGKLYGMIVLDNSTGRQAAEIKKFDYDKLLTKFKNPLELRKIDYHEYPVFGILYTETERENIAELDYILSSDLNEFVE
ncbi:MAG: ATP-grasp domain-containing protein [Desulfobacterales bacterium]|nr:MAG: ATP-grasp domain-containing protein [Desulfobacterales bacterium]